MDQQMDYDPVNAIMLDDDNNREVHGTQQTTLSIIKAAPTALHPSSLEPLIHFLVRLHRTGEFLRCKKAYYS